MSKSISGDNGMSVNTQALRDDMPKWEEESKSLLEKREIVQNASIRHDNIESIVHNGILDKALELARTYLEYCKQGADEFTSISESLQKAAQDYENNEHEVF